MPSNFPHGFNTGVSIRGVAILNSYSNNAIYVDSNAASNGNGTFSRPMATIDAAINRCTASKGDLILVKAGHAETLTATGAITMDVAGVNIIGLGSGNNRPVLTCTCAAVGTNVITWSAANCSMQNLVVIGNLDAITNPVNISGANAWCDIEYRDASVAIEAATAILTTATADNLYIKCKYIGFDGNACVSPIQLVGCTGGRIDIDYYGKASTAVVEFTGTLCSDIYITGNAHNVGDTTGAKLVVDTATSSIWYADIVAGAAGNRYSGGSAAALASDDISVANATLGAVATAAATGAVTATDTLMAYIKQLVTQNGIELDTNTLGSILYGTGGIAAFPAAAAPANAVSLAEVIRQIYAALEGTAADQNGVLTWPTAAAYANNVSIAEVLGYIQDAVRRGTGAALPANTSIADHLPKVISNTAAALVTGTTIFTIAGGPIEIVHLSARCVTANNCVASTLQWSADPTDGAAATISGASGSLANAVAGGVVTLQGTALSTAALYSATGHNLGPTIGTYVGAGILTTTVAIGSTTGTWMHHMVYRPLAAGVTVV